MNTENIISYIKSGMNYENSFLRKGCFSFVFVSLLAIIPGIVLGKEMLIIAIIMQIVSLVNCIFVFILTTKQRTVKKRLWINLIFPICSIINLLLLSVMVFIISFGINVGIVTLFLPVIFTAILVYVRTNHLLKKDVPIDKKIRSNHIVLSLTFTGVCSASSGVWGMRLGEVLLDDANQMTVTIVILSIMILGTCLFSISFNNILKLHYLYKLENAGIKVNEAIIPGIIYLTKQKVNAITNQGTVL